MTAVTTEKLINISEQFCKAAIAFMETEEFLDRISIALDDDVFPGDDIKYVSNLLSYVFHMPEEPGNSELLKAGDTIAFIFNKLAQGDEIEKIVPAATIMDDGVADAFEQRGCKNMAQLCHKRSMHNS